MDITEAQKQLESVLAQHNAEAEILSQGDDAKIYKLSSKDTELEIILNPKWIGYDLVIKKPVDGHKIGTSEDTDNYPLTGEYAEVARMVLTHVLECLKGLLMGRILIGHEGEQPILVIPTSEDTYLVKRFQFRKKWWQLFDSSESKEVRKDQLPKGLVPLE